MADALDIRAVPVALVCAHCGSSFLYHRPPGSRRFPRTCSIECKAKMAAAGIARRAAGVYENRRPATRKPRPSPPAKYTTVCHYCGKNAAVKTQGAKFCSSHCCQEHHKAANRAKAKVLEHRDCQACGASFEQRAPNQVWCSEACKYRVYYPVKRARRRARTIGNVDPFKVFDRDGWRCHLCNRKTPKSKRGSTEPDAPELDHIVPISKGGPHTYENTACSCRACNLSKGAKPMGQMLLFG